MAVYLTITNPALEDFEMTMLSKPAAANDTVLNVLSGRGFKKNDILLIGNYGEENAEIAYVSSTTDPTDTQITLTSGLKFAHSVNTPVRFMPFDQFKIYISNDGGISYNLADTILIAPDSNQTIYVSPAAPTALFKVASYNSRTDFEGPLSDAILGTGLGFSQLGRILDRVYDLYNDPEQKFIKSDEMLLNYLNEGFIDLFTRMSALGEGYATKKIDNDIQLRAGVNAYDLPEDFSKMAKVLIDYSGNGDFAIAKKMDLALIDERDVFSEDEPGYCLLHDKIMINPTPKTSNGKMRLYYVYSPKPLEYITDKLPLPAPDLASKILVDYCIARVYEKAFKTERASYFLQAYENGVSAWLTAIAGRSEDIPKFVHRFGEDWETPWESGSYPYY
jgi:hypothetical protein